MDGAMVLPNKRKNMVRMLGVSPSIRAIFSHSDTVLVIGNVCLVYARADTGDPCIDQAGNSAW